MEKEFLKVFNEFSPKHRRVDIWRDFVVMSACSISNAVDKKNWDKRETLYLDTIKRYDKKDQMRFPKLFALTVEALEQNPEQDFLGKIFMQLNLGSKSTSQFFTPYTISDLMARVTVTDVVDTIKKNGYISINDPTCGAGSTIIAGIHEIRRQLEKEKMNYQDYIFVVAQDIDLVVGLMCYIQLSLLGVAGCVKIGNSLTEPFGKNDNPESLWYTPVYFFDIWVMRRLADNLKSLTKPTEKTTNPKPIPIKKEETNHDRAVRLPAGSNSKAKKRKHSMWRSWFR